MGDTKRQRIANFYIFAERIGVDADTADKLRRIEMTLRRWAEAECNGEIQRDGENGEGKPQRYYGPNMDRSYPIADREAGALKRLAAIMATLPDLVAYHQTDPRGCALYLVPKDKLTDGADIGSVYNRGFGVCY